MKSSSIISARKNTTTRDIYVMSSDEWANETQIHFSLSPRVLRQAVECFVSDIASETGKSRRETRRRLMSEYAAACQIVRPGQEF